MRDKVIGVRRWVVKIGSALLTADGHGLDRNTMAVQVEQMVALHCAGVELVLVSFGVVAAGISRLGWVFRPSTIYELQAAAPVGQMELVQVWESSFTLRGLQVAQALLTHSDLSDRKRYLNTRSILRTLAELDVVPVISENDTVVADEIRLGDNDTLAALAANLIEADLLVILTDHNDMLDTDPRSNPGAQLVYGARADDPQLDAVADGSADALGRDGMQTKLRTARLAARFSRHIVIVGGRIERVLDHLHVGERLNTPLTPDRSRKAARKQWLTGYLQICGTLVLDDGAVEAVGQDHKSLLPIGIRAVQDSFRHGEMVVCVDQGGREVMRGLANYSALEVQETLGRPTDAIETLLGYVDGPEPVYCDNLVLV